MAAELEEVKRQVAQAKRVLSDVGLASGVTSALGHASMRVPSQPDRFVVKDREYANVTDVIAALDDLGIPRAHFSSMKEPTCDRAVVRPQRSYGHG